MFLLRYVKVSLDTIIKEKYNMLDEDKLTIQEVVDICQTTRNDNIEIRDDNLLNTKTTDFMDKYEFLEDDIRDEIHRLEIKDYHSGPLEDKNTHNKHPVWVFMKTLNRIKVLVYIKIKIINHKRKIILYSFHEEGLHDENK